VLIQERVRACLYFFSGLGTVQWLLWLLAILDWCDREQEDLGPLTPVGNSQRSLFRAFDHGLSADDLAGPLRKLPADCHRAANLIEDFLETEGAQVAPEDEQPEDESGIAHAIDDESFVGLVGSAWTFVVEANEQIGTKTH